MNKAVCALLSLFASVVFAQEQGAWYAGADFFSARNTFKTTVSGSIKSPG